MTWTSARDCRSILIPFLAERPGRVFTGAELALMHPADGIGEATAQMGTEIDRTIEEMVRNRSEGPSGEAP